MCKEFGCWAWPFLFGKTRLDSRNERLTCVRGRAATLASIAQVRNEAPASLALATLSEALRRHNLSLHCPKFAANGLGGSIGLFKGLSLFQQVGGLKIMN